jgi:PKD repeat protein
MIKKRPCNELEITCYMFILIVCATIFCACQRNPVRACFTYQPASNITPQMVVTFDATCSKNANYVRWNFGDGRPDTFAVDGVFTISHIYAAPGNYKVLLMVVKGKDQVWGNDEPFSEQTVIVK